MAGIITIFRSRLREEFRGEYEPVAERMLELARAMPGFVAFKTFTAPDGERVSIVEFESEEATIAWRDHPAHRAAQELGRKKFYSEYSIQVCDVMRAYGSADAHARLSAPEGALAK
jgi:heme-degrading monooxygenase HmoA